MAGPPDFQTMWNAYPTGASPDVRKQLGGKVDDDRYENTCAIRMSATLNKVGRKVPNNPPGLYTVKDKDKNNIALRMKELADYLEKQWGKAIVRAKRPGSKHAFQGKQGVIAFIGIPGYTGGGHIDLWDGQKTQKGDYFDSEWVLLFEQKKTGQKLVKFSAKVGLRQTPADTAPEVAFLNAGSQLPLLETQGSVWLKINASPALWVKKGKGVTVS